MKPIIFDSAMSVGCGAPKRKLPRKKTREKAGNPLQITSRGEFFSIRVEDCVLLASSLGKKIFNGGGQNTEPVN